MVQQYTLLSTLRRYNSGDKFWKILDEDECHKFGLKFIFSKWVLQSSLKVYFVTGIIKVQGRKLSNLN